MSGVPVTHHLLTAFSRKAISAVWNEEHRIYKIFLFSSSEMISITFGHWTAIMVRQFGGVLVKAKRKESGLVLNKAYISITSTFIIQCSLWIINFKLKVFYYLCSNTFNHLGFIQADLKRNRGISKVKHRFNDMKLRDKVNVKQTMLKVMDNLRIYTDVVKMIRGPLHIIL